MADDRYDRWQAAAIGQLAVTVSGYQRGRAPSEA